MANSGDSTSDRKTSRLGEVMADYVRDHEAGKLPNRERLLAQHPDLAEELREFFRHRDRMEELLDPLRSIATRVLNIRCPHCHHSVELLDDERISSISCPSCGSNFSLVGTTSTGRPLGLKRIGQFQLVEQVGIGQFGSVWKARDLTLERTVAIKIPRQRQLNEMETEVFLRDARVAARLNHTNIVSVHEVGKHEDTTYIVSDFIQGASLKEWVVAKRLTFREAAELCVTVATALHYAHESGVVHRDLKPGNIMMDVSGKPHIVDFGLAKRDAGEITMTIEGQILGTPAYMSPEQASGDAHQVDRRADIYSLGVILFELLTGELPFRGDKQMLLVQIIKDMPPSPRKLNAMVPRDLETVCLKCLEKEPHRRYETAQSFADDCKRFLQGIPVLARPVSRLTRGWRWCQRNPHVAGLSTAVAALLVGITIVASAGYLRTQTALGIANERAGTIEQNLYYSEMNRAADAAKDPDGLAQVAGLLEKWLPQNTQVDRRGWEWYYLDSILHQDIATLEDHEGGVFSVAWSPDGSRLASASGDWTIKIWASDGRVFHTLRGHSSQVNSVGWNDDGTLLASASYDGTVRIWDATKGTELKKLEHEGPVDSASWSHDGHWLASTSLANTNDATQHSTVSIWSSASWEKERELPAPTQLYDLRWNPRRSQISVASRDARVRIWDPATGAETHNFEGYGGGAWNYDGTQLAIGIQNTMNVWNVAKQQQIATFEKASGITCAAWDPKRSLLAYTAGHKAVTVFNVETKSESLTLRGHINRVTAVCWHPQGHRIATGSIDGFVKVWNATEPPRFSPGSATISWNPSGSLYASRIGSSVVLCDPETARTVRWLNGHEGFVLAVAWSPDGASVASASHGGEVRIWDVATGAVKCSVNTQLPDLEMYARLPTVLAWKRDSRQLAFLQNDFVIRIVDAESTDTIQYLEGHTDHVKSFAWSPDDRRIASGGDDEIVHVWNPLTGQLENSLGSSEYSAISAVCWNADGSRIATANSDSNVYIWDMETGRRLHRLGGHTTYVHTVSWSSDGLRIASADESGTIRIWDANTGQQTLTLSYPGGVPMVAWNPDGQSLAGVGFGGNAEVRIWDAEVRQPDGAYW